ncbi:MAG: helix-turn-helix transcriptional regulator [Ferrovibrio sp.]|uniref:helix-turn-helix transcriptional regulator n=1 Tax=Ferrovibrio sp. TaxID=1917215 RepID=UPI0035B435F2
MPALLTTKEAARLLRVDPQTMFRWRKDGTGPAYIRVAQTIIRYREIDLIWFIDNNRHRSLADESSKVTKRKSKLSK